MRIPYKQLQSQLLADAESVLRQWLPNGKISGQEYCVGSIRGESGKSLCINLITGLWKDFADDSVSGKCLISLYADIHGMKFNNAVLELQSGNHASVSEENIPSSDPAAKKLKAPEPVYNFPERITGTGAIKIFNPNTNKTSPFKPEAIYPYADAVGNIYGYVLRLRKTDGSKWTPAIMRSESGWMFHKFPAPRMLYNIANLASCESVIVVEGEKCVNALQPLFPSLAIVTWSGGVGAKKLTDFSPLKNKTVYLWPDAGKAGIEAMQYVAGEAHRHGISDIYIIDVTGFSDGWDVADGIDAGWNREAIEKFIQEKKQRAIITEDTEPAPKKRPGKSETETKNLPAVIETEAQPRIQTETDPYAWVNNVSWVAGSNPIFIGQYPVMIDKRSLHNAALILKNWPDASDALIYNIFEDDIYIVKCPPWDNREKFSPHKLRAEDYTKIRIWLETVGFRIGLNDIESVTIMVAKQNETNPPKDYFESLKWDGTPRLKSWLTYYLGASSQPEEYLAAVGTKWLVGAVSRVYVPGTKFDTCLFLEGSQGIGKSTTLQELATFNGQSYFTDQNIEFNDKDSLLILQGKIIAEMADLVSFKRAETNEIKAFITRRTDIYRPPYARSPIERPRMFVLAGTHNPENEGYFSDATGNRRYWPVKCGDRIDIEALRDNKNQLWAEAVHLYKSGMQTWLSEDEIHVATHEQEMRLFEDALIDDARKYIAELTAHNTITNGFTTNDLLDKLKIPPERKTNVISSRVKKIISRLGYHETQVKQFDGSRPRVWVKTTATKETEKNIRMLNEAEF